ncbi:MAG: hypothetical protein ACHQHN_19250 [Sphingobacteriales bacterium]
MLLFNEKNKQLTFEEVKAELKDVNAGPAPSIEDVKKALGQYYSQALELQTVKFQTKATLTPLTASTNHDAFLRGFGGGILGELKKIICGILDGTSTEDQIIQAILDALIKIIPGGVFFAALAKIIVKYILSTGIAKFCAVPPVPPAQK